MRNLSCVLGIAVALALSACGPTHPVNSAQHSVAAATGGAADEAPASRSLTDARGLLAARNWPAAIQVLQGVIDAPSFVRLSPGLQHEILGVAADAALNHGSPAQALDWFIRATVLPDAGFEDWLGRLRAADKLDSAQESVSTLTVLVQRWPANSVRLKPRYIFKVIDEAKKASPDSALPLLLGLYDAQWKLKWDIEPSDAWRELILRLVEKGQLARAVEVSAHVTDVYELIAMRADRRFDAVVAANAMHFDIDEAARLAFRTFQAAAEHAPESLELQVDVMEALLSQQRYEAALAASDSVLVNIRSTNYPAKLYTDYDDYANWLFDERADLLERVGRWDDAVVQLTAASRMPEDHTGNVGQLINLAQLYCDLGRPREAIAALDRITAKVSPYGAMQREEVRVEASSQLGDSAQVARSLRYLEAHRADAPKAYENALVSVNSLDLAANVLRERLQDRDQRARALVNVQTFAAPPRTPRQSVFFDRWRTVLARRDVQAAIRQVGRIEQYRLEER